MCKCVYVCVCTSISNIMRIAVTFSLFKSICFISFWSERKTKIKCFGKTVSVFLFCFAFDHSFVVRSRRRKKKRFERNCSFIQSVASRVFIYIYFFFLCCYEMCIFGVWRSAVLKNQFEKTFL